MTKKMQFAIGIALVGLFVASFAAIAPKAVKAAIATLIRDQDNAARHPFTMSCSASTSVPMGGVTCFTPSIPAGQQVVIETVGMEVVADPSDTRITPSVSTVVSGVSQLYPFTALSDNGTAQPTVSQFSVTESLRLYADPGTQIQCTMVNSRNSDKILLCSVSGYFVTLP